MEKESLYILKLDTQGSKVKFPNADMPAKLGEYTYTAQRMAGTPTLTATLNYPSCLDELWTGEEFVEFRGENIILTKCLHPQRTTRVSCTSMSFNSFQNVSCWKTYISWTW